MKSATVSTELLGKGLALWQRIVLYVVLLVLVALAAWVVEERPYTPGSRLGYDLGLSGGLMMLALLLYPLRKHWGRLHNAGSLRAWFAVHLFFGIGGPLLVLFHTCFQLHSFNASVAFWCMVVVALSGAAGRFVYLRVYTNLATVNARLWEIEGVMETHVIGNVNPFALAPKAREWIEEYRRHPFARRSSWWEKLRRAFADPKGSRRRARGARKQIAAAIQRHARREGWSSHKLDAEVRSMDAMILEYVHAVDSAVKLSFWERAAAWWHVAHGPFVYVLLFSAVAHVIAVHIY